MRDPRPAFDRVRTVYPYAWLWEPLETDPTFVLRPMFGTRAVYLGGRLMLCFAARAEPWRGVLVCTERAHQESLCREWPELAPHPVLPKWLYLPESADGFERVAAKLVEWVRRHDPRIGVTRSPRNGCAETGNSAGWPPLNPRSGHSSKSNHGVPRRAHAGSASTPSP